LPPLSYKGDENMQKLREGLSMFQVCAATSLDPTDTVETDRLTFDGYREILFHFEFEAADNEAWLDDTSFFLNVNHSATPVGTPVTTVKSVEVVGGQNVLSGVIWTEDHADGDSVTVNGVEFARTTIGYGVSSPLDWSDNDELRDGINNNVEGVLAATLATSGVNVSVVDTGSRTINVDMDFAAATPHMITSRACADVDIFCAAVGEDYVFVEVDNDNPVGTMALAGTLDTYCVALKGKPYHSPSHHVTAARG